MKRYVVGLVILIAHNVCAMEVSLLSSEDDAKALRLAKLFNKYPYGYGENKECIDINREKINWFLNEIKSTYIIGLPFCRFPSESDRNKERIDIDKERKCFFQRFEHVSSRVKQYQALLNTMEAVECLKHMHTKLSADIKAKIFTIVLRDDAQQYYAVSNAIKFVILEPWLAFAGYYSGVMDVCYPCFLVEYYDDGKPTISFSDDGFMCELHCVDRSIIKAYSHPGYTESTLRLSRPQGKVFTEELIAFVNQDSKKARIDAFKKLVESWAGYLANETDLEKYKNTFIELLKRLNWHDIELSDLEDCKEILQREATLNRIEAWL